MKKLFILFLFPFWGIGGLFAQFQKPDISMPSPNAANLGLYGEVPVSLYTGTPNIDIPLYTLAEGKIKVPISLSYHASGIRVNQHPGWVGLNWNLNAGGAITRTVKDKPDELPVEGFYSSSSLINPTTIETPSGLSALPAVHQGQYGPEYYDYNPDEFNFNFMGISGKFFLSENRQWVVQSEQSLRVEWNSSDLLNTPAGLKTPLRSERYPYIKHFSNFKITTDDGTSYYFGSDENSIEYSLAFFGQRDDYWIATTWYLKKIRTREGREINYTYERETSESNGKYVAGFYTSWRYGSTVLTNPLGTCSGNNQNFQTSQKIFGGNLISPVYLRKISSNLYDVEFIRQNSTELKYPIHIIRQNYSSYPTETMAESFPYLMDYSESSQFPWWEDDSYRRLLDRMKWKQLSQIIVKDKGSNVIQSWSLNYSASENQRLTLNSVQQTDRMNSNCYIKHDLEYNQVANLPGYLDLNDKTDHWGFLNNNNFNLVSLKNNNSNTFHDYVTNKESSTDINVLKLGSLSKITYPTGGYTELEYETHSAYGYIKKSNTGALNFEPNLFLKIGGLRVKKLSSNDGSITKIKNFEYSFNDNGQSKSSGILSGIPEYMKSQNLNFGGYGSVAFFYMSTQNVLIYNANSDVNHITYREVKEINADLSYSIYRFTNYQSNDDGHMDEPVLARTGTNDGSAQYDPVNSKSFERGKIIYKGDFTALDKKSLEVVTTYRNVNTSDIKSIGVYRSIFTGPCVNFKYGLGGFNVNETLYYVQSIAYRNYYYKFNKNKETVYQYDQADDSRFTTDVTDYVAYNSLGMPTQIKTTRDGRSTTTYNKYAIDFDPAGASGTNPIVELQQIGATGVLVEQVTSNNDINYTGDNPVNVQRYVDGYLNIFRNDYPKSSGASNVQIWQTLKYIPSSLSTSFNHATLNGNGLVQDANFSKVIVQFPPTEPYNNVSDGYTSYGEPLRFKGADGVWNTFTWGTGGETGLLKSKTVGKTIGDDDVVKLAQTTNFTYAQPLVGISKIADPNGLETNYEYDGFNRLKIVRDHSDNLLKSYSYNLKNSTGCPQSVLVEGCSPSHPFKITIINIGSSQSGTKPGVAVPLSAWTDQFVTVDSGPELDNSTQSNPSIFYSENVNKVAPRFWTIYVDPCSLGTSGSISYDMLLKPESGVDQSFNTIENNAPYLMYANRDNFTELYAQNNPFFGFFTDNGSGGNAYDVGLPKGLYKLSLRYWSQKGLGVAPAVRTPQGRELVYKEYWFRIQSKNGIGQGAGRMGEKK